MARACVSRVGRAVLLLALLERELQPLPLAPVLLVGELARVHHRLLALLLPLRSVALLVDRLGMDELPLRRIGLRVLLLLGQRPR
jgi:hypothetical protein